MSDAWSSLTNETLPDNRGERMNALHRALAERDYITADNLINQSSDEFLLESYSNNANQLPTSNKTCLHMIAAIHDDEKTAVKLCENVLKHIEDLRLRDRLTNAVVTEDLDIDEKMTRVSVAAIHIAAFHGVSGVVRLLFQAGVDPNVSSKRHGEQRCDGLTALHWGALRGHVAVVRQLMTLGANVNARTSTGDTPLTIAMHRGHADVVEVLLDSGHQLDLAYNSTPLLYDVARRGETSMAMVLLDRRPNAVNAPSLGGSRPLHAAVQVGDIAMAALLVDRGAEVNAGSDDGTTPLFVTAQAGRSDMVGMLLDRGADANGDRHSGATPLFIAAQCGNTDVVRLLAERGACVNSRRLSGATPLLVAAQQGHLGVVIVLLDAGASVSIRRSDGVTALYAAAQNGHVDVMKKLLAADGADVNARCTDGSTALLIAAQRGVLDVVRLLMGRGADVNAASDDGVTPLFLAVQNNHREVVELLLTCAADKDAKRLSDGADALRVAKYKGYQHIVDMLNEPTVFGNLLFHELEQ